VAAADAREEGEGEWAAADPDAPQPLRKTIEAGMQPIHRTSGRLTIRVGASLLRPDDPKAKALRMSARRRARRTINRNQKGG